MPESALANPMCQTGALRDRKSNKVLDRHIARTLDIFLATNIMSLDDIPVFEPARPPLPGEDFTLEKLQDHLQSAIYVEMSTIPLYLYAYYSIKPVGHGNNARDTIKSVFVEEMLHLALASNTLYALGKAPILYSKTHIPDFPKDILYTAIRMHLRDGRRDNIQTFVDVEAPLRFPTPFDMGHILKTYGSIGEFYGAVKRQLEKHGCSIKETKNQISNDDNIWNDDKLIVVSNLEKAMEAMETIVDQGEGSGHSDGHYQKFLDLRSSSNNWEWHPVLQDPKTESHQGKIFYEVLRTFDSAYCYLVLNIERLYRVSGNKRKDCSNNINDIMWRGPILTPLAEFLQDEWVDDKTVAGPCFNYYPLDSNTPLKSLKEEIAAAVAKYTGDRQKKLKDIQGAINGLKDLPAAD